MSPAFRYCPRCAMPLVERAEEGPPKLACPGKDCGFVHYDNPLPVVAAIVEHEGAVVLVRNKGWPESWFGLVTGFLERGESPEAGTLRELREELGLDGEIVRLVGVYPFEMMNQLIVAYHVRARGSLVLGEELAAFKRVPPEKLRPWPTGTGQAVADWLASRS
jgi:NADH pyrophosphatase NudC (nudix superfamily)